MHTARHAHLRLGRFTLALVDGAAQLDDTLQQVSKSKA